MSAALLTCHRFFMLHLAAAAQDVSKMQWLSHLALHLSKMQSQVQQTAGPWTAELTVHVFALQAT